MKGGCLRYRCRDCNHQWKEHSRRHPAYEGHYEEWLFGRRTLSRLAADIGISVPTLRQKFDDLPSAPRIKPPPDRAVNLIIDATFFGREYGYLCFHDKTRIAHFREIRTESLAELEAGLDALVAAGYRFKSFTLDGKPGFMRLLRRRFPGTPVQMCQFHQKAIVRRYITNTPKTPCGLALKDLMARFGKQDPQSWIDDLFALRDEYKTFLAGKNENGGYSHRRLRSAFRSLNTNLPHLFVCDEIPEAGIPATSNRLEGAFAHLKEKILIHRGLNIDRKKKAIEFILYKT